MKETSKCYPKRLSKGHFKKYLHGFGIDIGCGNDLLKITDGKVVPFDKQDGDAQYLPDTDSELFDFVYSSHCLEHMVDVPTALKSWVRVLKPEGYLYFVVPDYLFYEKHCWPSRFNEDHKQTFSSTLIRKQVGRTNHWHIPTDLAKLLTNLGCNVIESFDEFDGYDFNRGAVDQTLGPALAQICVISQKKAR